MTVNVSEWPVDELKSGTPLRPDSPAGERPLANQQVAPGATATLSATTHVIRVVSDAPVLIGIDAPAPTTYLDPYERHVFPVKPGGTLVTQAVS